jgi:hypothetical protein
MWQFAHLKLAQPLYAWLKPAACAKRLPARTYSNGYKVRLFNSPLPGLAQENSSGRRNGFGSRRLSDSAGSEIALRGLTDRGFVTRPWHNAADKASGSRDRQPWTRGPRCDDARGPGPGMARGFARPRSAGRRVPLGMLAEKRRRASRFGFRQRRHLQARCVAGKRTHMGDALTSSTRPKHFISERDSS